MLEVDPTVTDPSQANPGSSDTENVDTPSPAAEDTPAATDSILMNADPDKVTPPVEPEGAPEKYEDFTVPDGVKLGDTAKGQIQALAKELNLTQEVAQKLADHFIKDDADADVAQKQADTDRDAKNVQESKNHPKYGGANFETSVKMGDRVVNQFANQSLKDILVKTGLASNPHVFEFLNNISAVISDDVFVGSDIGGGEKTFDKLTDIFPQPPIAGVT